MAATETDAQQAEIERLRGRVAALEHELVEQAARTEMLETLADFDDETALYAYQKDPMHVDVAQAIRKRVSLIKVIDFVTSD